MNTDDVLNEIREWTKEEDAQLHTSYNVDMLPIMEIYKKMNIYPWFINKRLYELKFTKGEYDTRGINDYRFSSIYFQSPHHLKIGRYMPGMAYSN